MLLQALCSISYPFVNLNWSYSAETANLGKIWQFLAPCDLEIWRMTLEKQKGTSPKQHQAICIISSSHVNSNWSYSPETLGWVVTSVTLTFDLWPWPFAWTLPWSLVITPENCMMIWWWEYSQKGVTDRQTDGQTDIHKIPFINLLDRS